MARETTQEKRASLQIRRDRLPTLHEVLGRKTAAPLDLYCYYLYLQREGAEDTLDFWLDVQQHENLCRAYFKDLRKSGRSIKEDWPQYYDLARKRGSIFNHINRITVDKNAYEKDEQERLHGQSVNPSLADAMSNFDEKNDRGYGSLGIGNADAGRSTLRTPSPTSNAHNRPDTALSPTLRALYPSSPNADEEFGGGNGNSGRRSLSGMGSRSNRNVPVRPYITRDAAITRTDLIASAELIYARYLLQGAEKEIYLPPALRVHSFPLNAGQLPSVNDPEYEHESGLLARVPDLYHQQKEYVYRQMEQFSFPRFLRAKSFGNLTPLSALIRLCIGLLALWAGLSTAFALIFLDIKPKARRLWIILPLSIAVLCIVSHAYDLDPILVFFGRSETTPFKTLKIREPYVKKLLLGRAVWVTLLTILVVALLTILFTLVPGHRL